MHPCDKGWCHILFAHTSGFSRVQADVEASEQACLRGGRVRNTRQKRGGCKGFCLRFARRLEGENLLLGEQTPATVADWYQLRTKSIRTRKCVIMSERMCRMCTNLHLTSDAAHMYCSCGTPQTRTRQHGATAEQNRSECGTTRLPLC